MRRVTNVSLMLDSPDQMPDVHQHHGRERKRRKLFPIARAAVSLTVTRRSERVEYYLVPAPVLTALEVSGAMHLPLYSSTARTGLWSEAIGIAWPMAQ